MPAIHYRYSESELKKILQTLEIIVDTREQKNQHVLEYFHKKKVPFTIRGMKTCDYSQEFRNGFNQGCIPYSRCGEKEWCGRTG